MDKTRNIFLVDRDPAGKNSQSVMFSVLQAEAKPHPNLRAASALYALTMLSARKWNAGAARRQVSTIRINQFGENIWSRPLDDEFLAGVGIGNSRVPPTLTDCLFFQSHQPADSHISSRYSKWYKNVAPV